MKIEISEELRNKLRKKAHVDAIGKFISDGSELAPEEAYDYMSEIGGETPDPGKVALWQPFEGFYSNVIVEYINTEEEALFQSYVMIADVALDENASNKSEWDVELECRVRKIIRVEAESANKAEEIANELFSVLNDGTEEHYTQDVVSCRKA